jgi:hypothetical protein
VQPVAVPVVERLLTVPAGLDGVSSLGLPDQGFNLTALDSAIEKLLPQGGHIELRIRDSWSKRRSVPVSRAPLLEAGQPIFPLPGAGADFD